MVDVDKQAEKIVKMVEDIEEHYFTNLAPIYMDEEEFDEYEFEQLAIQQEREEGEV